MSKAFNRLTRMIWLRCTAGLLLLSACKHADETPLAPKHSPVPSIKKPTDLTPQLVTHEPKETEWEREGLEHVLLGAPYAAVMQHTAVEVSSADENTDKHVRHANILQTIRGPVLKTIDYVMYTEKGEKTESDTEAQLVALCTSEGEYQWPGTGSLFPWTDATKGAVRKIQKSLPKQQTSFSWCE